MSWQFTLQWASKLVELETSQIWPHRCDRDRCLPRANSDDTATRRSLWGGSSWQSRCFLAPRSSTCTAVHNCCTVYVVSTACSLARHFHQLLKLSSELEKLQNNYTNDIFTNSKENNRGRIATSLPVSPPGECIGSLRLVFLMFIATGPTKVHNVLHCCHWRIEIRPQMTRRANFVTCSFYTREETDRQTDIQTDRQTRWSQYFTPLPEVK